MTVIEVTKNLSTYTVANSNTGIWHYRTAVYPWTQETHMEPVVHNTCCKWND